MPDLFLTVTQEDSISKALRAGFRRNDAGSIFCLSAGFDIRNQSCVTGKLIKGGKPRNIRQLGEQNHGCQRADARTDFSKGEHQIDTLLS